MDPLSTARYGLMAATRQVDAAAQKVAGGSDADYTGSTIDLIEAKHSFSANLGVVKISDEMWRALIDIQST